MVDIKIDTSSNHGRSRRKSGFGQGFIRLLFFLATLVPTCIIAWRIDLVNPRQQVVVQQPQPEVQPRIENQSPAPRRIESPPARPPRIQAPPPVTEGDLKERDFDIRPRVPRDPPKQPEPRPSQSIVLKFDDKRQRERITLTGNLRLVRVESSKYSMKPSDGNPAGAPVEVTLLDGPRPILLTATLQERSDARFLLIEPTVTNDADVKVPFTNKDIKRIGIRFVKDRDRAAGQLNAMKAELVQVKSIVDAPNLVPLATYRAAQRRVKELQGLIPQGEKAVAALDIEVKAAQELYNFAERLHGECKLVVESVSG